MKHGDKRRYKTEAEAIGRALRSSKRSGKPIRVYRCDECHGWHLTKRRRWTPPQK